MADVVHADRIEFDVVSHCNLRCYGCGHFSPFAETWFASPDAFERDVSTLSKYLHARMVRLIGGEPLLHPDLLDFVRIARRSAIADYVEVGTNALLLARQPREFWQTVDSVQISLYPECREHVDLRLIRRLAAASGTKLVLEGRPAFIEPAVDFPTERARLVRHIFSACIVGRYCRTIRNGRLYRCAESAYIDDYLSRLGYNTSFGQTDGLLIEERDDMVGRIRALFRSPRPLGACTFCLGSVGRPIVHRQMTKEEVADPVRWRRAEDLVDTAALKATLRWIKCWPALGRMPKPLRRAVSLILQPRWLLEPE